MRWSIICVAESNVREPSVRVTVRLFLGARADVRAAALRGLTAFALARLTAGLFATFSDFMGVLPGIVFPPEPRWYARTLLTLPDPAERRAPARSLRPTAARRPIVPASVDVAYFLVLGLARKPAAALRRSSNPSPRFGRRAGHSVYSRAVPRTSVRRPLRHLMAYGNTNKYRPLSRSNASGSSGEYVTQGGGIPRPCASATKLAMTVTVKAIDSQRCVCRIHVFQFMRPPLKRVGSGSWTAYAYPTSESAA